MKLVDAKQMRSLDRRAMRDYGIKGIILMENAGLAVADAVGRELASMGTDRVVVVAGKGNNGGDGFVCARHLKNRGYRVTLLCTEEPERLRSDAGVNARIWQRMGGKTLVVKDAAGLDKGMVELRHAGLIVDGLFGTGLTKPVEGLYRRLIECINGLQKRVVAVDVPSGIEGSTGRVLGCAVRATLTVTMGLPKLGLYIYPGREYAGRVEVADISMPRELLSEQGATAHLIDDAMVRAMLKPRGGDCHKGSFGHLLVVGGSTGKAGAPCMSGLGGLRAGAGLVTVAVPRTIQPHLEARVKELMTWPLAECVEGAVGSAALEGLDGLLKGKTAVVVGPGMGTHGDTGVFLKALLKKASGAAIPVVVDADGLNLIAASAGAKKDGWVLKGAVLTPHPGEMARLMGVDTATIQQHRQGWAQRLAKQSGAVVVLKGASTVVATAKEFYINPTGNPALATAGTGDVLAGIIGGLMAQGLTPLEASVAGVYLHGLCADRFFELYGDRGMVATELLGEMPAVINSFVDRG